MNRRLREEVWSRAEGCCEYCRIPQLFDPLPFQIDHIIATQHQGETVAENLCVACYACNHHKGPNIAGFDLATGQVTALFHPRRDLWHEHFVWQGPALSGMTPIGRVTVHVLAINLEMRIALRRILNREGVFPAT